MASKYGPDDGDAKVVHEGAKGTDVDDFHAADSKWDDDEHAGSKDEKSSPSRAETKPERPLTQSEIIDKLQAYFFEDDRLSDYFEQYIKDNCYIVDLDSEEYKLEYTEVYNDYKRKFEEKVESFIESNLKVSIHDVYGALKHVVETDENSMGAFFAQILIAVTDFDVFMTVMREMASAARAERK
ncbi:hypothetical protein EON65_32010 [archaeon]|nr:MAG: hypothetical protein EON65_32010 [archaeon]